MSAKPSHNRGQLSPHGPSLLCHAPLTDVIASEALATYSGVAIQTSMLYIQLKRSKQHRKVGEGVECGEVRVECGEVRAECGR